MNDNLFDIQFAKNVIGNEELTMITLRNFLKNNENYTNELRRDLDSRNTHDFYIKIYNVQTFAFYIGAHEVLRSAETILKDLEKDDANLISLNQYIEDFTNTYSIIEGFVKYYDKRNSHYA